MPWFWRWSESIKKRACRYLLHHYLGQFLQEKLRLDQLSVDLYNGTGHVNNVPLDVWALNELFEQAQAPVEIIDGYIGTIVVSIPWSALLSDNCKVEIKGLEVTLQPKYRNETDFSIMTDSLYRSLGNMTTSMQLAEECLKGQEQTNDTQDADSGGLFEGLEVFAQTIESVLSRVKVSLIDTVIRVEHLPENSKTGIGLQIHIERIDYFDEKTMSEESDDVPSNSDKTKGSDTSKNNYQIESITSKRFRANGIKIMLDEFPEELKTSPRGSVEEFSISNPNKINGAAPINISCSPDTEFFNPALVQPTISIEKDVKNEGPVVIGKLYGWQELKLRIKQNKQVVGPKLNAECFLGSCSLFLTPHQIHLLTDFASGLISPNSSTVINTGSKSPQEHCVNLAAEHGIRLSPETGSSFRPREYSKESSDNVRNNMYSEDEEFFSMEASRISVSSFTTNSPPKEYESEYETSIRSGDSSTTGYSGSTFSSHLNSLRRVPSAGAFSKMMGAGHYYNRHDAGEESTSLFNAAIPRAPKSNLKSSSPPYQFTGRRHRNVSISDDKGVGFNHCQYQLQLSGLIVTVLHINPLPTSTSNNNLNSSVDKNDAENFDDDQDTKEQNDSLGFVNEMLKNYFDECDSALETLRSSDVSEVRNQMADVCRPHDHLRIVATQMHLNCEQKNGSQTSPSSNCEVSIGRAEITECLFSCSSNGHKSKKNTTSPKARREDQNKTPVHSEILVFNSDQYTVAPPVTKSVYMSFYPATAPNVKIRLTQNSTHRSVKTSLYIHLEACESEVDISIVDRLSTFLYPSESKLRQPTTATSLLCPPLPSFSPYPEVNRQAVFNEAMTEDYKDKQFNLNISASFLKVNFRFPIADLRPEMERTPWFSRSLRDEFLVLEAQDIAFVTSAALGSTSNVKIGNRWQDSPDSNQEFEVTVKDLHALYSDEPDKPPKSFLRITQSVDEQEPFGTTMDASCDLDYPHIKITMSNSNEEKVNPFLNGNNDQNPKKNRETKDNEFSSFEDDFPMTGSHKHSSNNPSPFSKRRVVYNTQEMILPGNSTEIQNFIEHATSTAKVCITLHLPAVNVFLVSKSFFESLYNRINNDILLWEPAAPKPHRLGKNGFDSRSVSYLGDGTPDKGLDLASQLLLNTKTAGSSRHDSDEFESSDSDSSYSSTNYSRPSHINIGKRDPRSLAESTLHATERSLIAVTTKIGRGCLSAHCDVHLPDGSVSNSEHGEIVIVLENAKIFNVSDYCGNSLLDYVCIQVNAGSLYHKATVPSLSRSPIAVQKFTMDEPDHLDKIISHSDDGINSTFGSPTKSASDSQNMVTVVLKIETEENRPMKQCLVAADIAGAMLCHKFAKSGYSWLEQLIDFIDATDDKVLGYEPPSFVTEMHLHFCNSAVVYRPLYISPPLCAVITASSFSVSSNIVADSPTSFLHIVVDEANLYITQRSGQHAVDLLQDYVNVLDVNAFEICLRLSTENIDELSERQYPIVDLQASNNMVRLRTCADSAAALAELVKYLADDGDLSGGGNCEDDDATTDYEYARSPPSLGSEVFPERFPQKELDHPVEEDADNSEVPDLLEDAMEDIFEDASSNFPEPVFDRNTSMTESMYVMPTGVGKPEPIFQQNKKMNIMSQSVMIPSQSSGKRKNKSWKYGSNRHHSHHYGGGLPKIEQCDVDDDEFCIIDDDPGIGVPPRDGEPDVKYFELSEENEEAEQPATTQHVTVVENHFKPTLGKVDQLRAPDHFPKAVMRYTLKELSCVWFMYGGSDFETGRRNKTDKQRDSPQRATQCEKSPQHQQLKYNAKSSSLSTSGSKGKTSGRDHSMVMEVHFNKLRCQHEQYPEDTYEVARTVVIVTDFEVRDRLRSSQMNKFLYRFHSEASPKQTHAKTFFVKALQIRPEGPNTPPECRLRVSLQPLKLNIDQDTLSFLTNFFLALSNSVCEEDRLSWNTTAPSTTYETVMESSGTHRSSPKSHALYSVPVMSRPENSPTMTNTPPSISSSPGVWSDTNVKQNNMHQPLFFREVIFSPDVPIRLDYHGKRIDTEQGTFAGLLMGLGQLNCSQLKLKRVVHRHGLLGVDKLISYLLNEWAADIRANQLPSILGGVGPMHSVVQLFQGVKDLVWLPVEQYRKDGRLVRGLQRGATSFGTSTAMAALEITNRTIGLIQSAAETTYELVSPPELHKHERRARRNWKTLGLHAAHRQPADLREGMSNAITLVRHGAQDTVEAIVRVAQKEHERKGVTGAVGGVLRHIPPTLVRPVIMATEATTNVLSGIRNQIQPDAKEQDENKWKDINAIDVP